MERFTLAHAHTTLNMMPLQAKVSHILLQPQLDTHAPPPVLLPPRHSIVNCAFSCFMSSVLSVWPGKASSALVACAGQREGS